MFVSNAAGPTVASMVICTKGGEGGGGVFSQVSQPCCQSSCHLFAGTHVLGARLDVLVLCLARKRNIVSE